MGVSQALFQLRLPVVGAETEGGSPGEEMGLQRPHSALVRKPEPGGIGQRPRPRSASVRRQSRSVALQELSLVHDRWNNRQEHRGTVCVSYPRDTIRQPTSAWPQLVAMDAAAPHPLERWSPRFERAKQRRLQHEYNKAQKARTELHRPERRRAAEARSKRSKLWLARVIHIGLRASLLAHCLGADRNLTWDVPWDWGDDSEDGDSQLCVDDDADGAHHQRLERRVSSASFDDRRRKHDKIKGKEKWRNERMQEYIAAAKVIAQWFISIKF